MNKMDLTFSRICKVCAVFSYKRSSKRCYRRFPSEEVFGIRVFVVMAKRSHLFSNIICLMLLNYRVFVEFQGLIGFS